MSELVPTIPATPDVADNVHLVARNPEEMRVAQASLVQWFEAKASILEHDAAELEQSRDLAKQHGWSTEETLKRHARLARRRVDFYRRCKAAVEAGFCIVPNFDVDLFAIRTARRPRRVQSANIFRVREGQGSEGPAASQGMLVSPNPTAELAGTRDRTNSRGEPIRDAAGATEREDVWRSDDWTEEIDFPISVARPQIMSETARAMALEIFDEFGVQEGTQRRHTRSGPVKGDPIVVARIIDPRSTTYSRRFVTFLVAWYVNTQDL